jgi:RNase P subunit RPR2
MRTHGWRASNAPDGPSTNIRCKCGAVLTALRAGDRLSMDKRTKSESFTCLECGKTTQLNIIRAKNA